MMKRGNLLSFKIVYPVLVARTTLVSNHKTHVVVTATYCNFNFLNDHFGVNGYHDLSIILITTRTQIDAIILKVGTRTGLSLPISHIDHII